MSSVVGLLIATAVLLFFVGLRRYQTPPKVKARLAEYAMLSEEERAARRPYFQRKIRPFARRLVPHFRPLQPWIQGGDVATKLDWAGHPQGLDVEEFFGFQILCALGLCFLLLLPFSFGLGLIGALVILPIAALMGLFAPLIWLNARATERQRKINLTVPDALDMLTICVQAGLGFDASLQHIVERTTGPLSEEFDHFLGELQLGLPREECFDRLLQRNNSKELRTVVGALVQGQELGVPIAQTLEEQAEDMRIRRIQGAKEEGAKASPKISLITTILVAPAVMCMFMAVMIFAIVGEVIGGGFGL